MTRLGPYEVHPVAELFPLVEGEEFEELTKSISQEGLRDPIVLDASGSILIDGRNRYRACMKCARDPIFTRLEEGASEGRILDYIVSANVRRRHLSAGQRNFLGLELEPFYAAEAKKRQGERTDLNPSRDNIRAVRRGGGENRADERAAKITDGSGRGIQKAKKIMEVAPELKAKVMSEELSLEEAYKKALEIERENESRDPTPPPSSENRIALTTHDGQSIEYRLPKAKPSFNRTNDQVSWAAWTWNPITGCLHGCAYCYARELANKESYREAYPVGFTPLFHHERLDAPKNTEIPADVTSDSRLGRVFVCSMADLYGKWVPDEWIEKVHASCIAAPQWEYLMLTKFPRRYVGLKLPSTAWLGTSVDEQKRVRLAEEAFREIKGVRVKWLSLEPLLAPLKFSDLSMFDWIVIGSQSATNQPDGPVAAFAPPFEWVARLTDQAREAGCRVYHKPNLLGVTNSQSPGMKLIQEEPKLAPMKGRQISFPFSPAAE